MSSCSAGWAPAPAEAAGLRGTTTVDRAPAPGEVVRLPVTSMVDQVPALAEVAHLLEMRTADRVRAAAQAALLPETPMVDRARAREEAVLLLATTADWALAAAGAPPLLAPAAGPVVGVASETGRAPAGAAAEPAPVVRWRRGRSPSAGKQGRRLPNAALPRWRRRSAAGRQSNLPALQRAPVPPPTHPN